MICLETNYLEPIISSDSIQWSKKEYIVETKRLQLEKEEEQEAIRYQIKKGIIKQHMIQQPTTLTIKATEAPQAMKATITPPRVTKLKGYDMMEPCMCGNKEYLFQCLDCLKRINRK